jgi:hypothetical protein
MTMETRPRPPSPSPSAPGSYADSRGSCSSSEVTALLRIHIHKALPRQAGPTSNRARAGPRREEDLGCHADSVRAAAVAHHSPVATLSPVSSFKEMALFASIGRNGPSSMSRILPTPVEVGEFPAGVEVSGVSVVVVESRKTASDIGVAIDRGSWRSLSGDRRPLLGGAQLDK